MGWPISLCACLCRSVSTVCRCVCMCMFMCVCISASEFKLGHLYACVCVCMCPRSSVNPLVFFFHVHTQQLEVSWQKPPPPPANTPSDFLYSVSSVTVHTALHHGLSSFFNELMEQSRAVPQPPAWSSWQLWLRNCPPVGRLPIWFLALTLCISPHTSKCMNE